MTQLAQHPAFLQIEDRLDSLGQKCRLHRMLRGAVLFTTIACAGTFVATGAVFLMSRDGLGAGSAGYGIAIAWALTLIAAAAWWLARPLLMRPRAIEVARMIETRVGGLHNGLTNALLLADREDVAANPWSPGIIDEIAGRTLNQPLGDVVRMSDHRTMFSRCAMVLVPMLIVALIWPGAFARGWRQMLSPTTFVPAVGAAEIVSVDPGNVTRVAGHPLEVTVVAKGPADSTAKLIFDHALPTVALASVAGNDELLRFAGRVDHVDESLRYRVEVAGTQSEWLSVSIVRQIKLADLSLQITPPPYTHLPQKTLTIKPDAPNETPITVPQGSTVQLTAATDVPVSAALLQVGAGNVAPLPMTRVEKADRFYGKFTVIDDTPVSVLITDSSGNIAATLPASPLSIGVTKDAGPRIEVKWPTGETVVTPDAELKVRATLRDDYGLTGSRVLLAAGPDAPLTTVDTKNYADASGNTSVTEKTIELVLKVDPANRKHGQSIRVQIEATDNRALSSTGVSPVSSDGGHGRDARATE